MQNLAQVLPLSEQNFESDLFFEQKSIQVLVLALSPRDEQLALSPLVEQLALSPLVEQLASRVLTT